MTKSEQRMNAEVKPTKELREISIQDLENVHGGWGGAVGDAWSKTTSAGIVGPQDNPE